MRRSLFLAALVAAPLVATAQTKPEETQPSQGAAQPAPAPAAPKPPPKAELYGTLNVNTQWTRTFGNVNVASNVSPRLAISTDSTNIGVRGGLKVLDWANADYQCETQANVNGFDLRGLCGRNSKIGVSGAFGSFFYGNWDTPFKSVWYGTKADDPFGNTDVFNATNILGSPGFGYRSSGWVNETTGTATSGGVIPAPGTTITGFDIRANHSVSYWTPKFAGLQAKFMYGVNEFKNQTGTISPKLWSANAIYDRGPFSVVAAVEVHEDAFGLAGINPAFATGVTSGPFGATRANTTTVHSEDRAWRVAAGYELPLGTYGSTRIGGGLERIQYLQGAGAAGSIREFDRYAWQALIAHKMGKVELRARYGKANDGGCELVGGGACRTDGFGATGLALGTAYKFAPTTEIYLHYSDIRNGRNGQYVFNTGGAPIVFNRAVGAVRGADPQAIALGFRHAFSSL